MFSEEEMRYKDTSTVCVILLSVKISLLLSLHIVWHTENVTILINCSVACMVVVHAMFDK
jgi:hypothetical protein